MVGLVGLYHVKPAVSKCPTQIVVLCCACSQRLIKLIKRTSTNKPFKSIMGKQIGLSPFSANTGVNTAAHSQQRRTATGVKGAEKSSKYS